MELYGFSRPQREDEHGRGQRRAHSIVGRRVQGFHGGDYVQPHDAGLDDSYRENAATAIKTLGFSMFDAHGNVRPFEEAMRDLAFRLDRLETPYERVNKLNDIFTVNGARRPEPIRWCAGTASGASRCGFTGTVRNGR